MEIIICVGGSNMNILIGYAGKTGTTEKCAKLLAEKIRSAKVVDLNKEIPDLNDYDVVVLGGSIRMGMLHKKVKQFIQTNYTVLKQKKTAYFICNGFPEQVERMYQQNFSQDLIDSAICIDTFGGEINLAKQKGIDKLITKMVMKSTKEGNSKLPTILIERIDNFAKLIKKAIGE